MRVEWMRVYAGSTWCRAVCVTFLPTKIFALPSVMAPAAGNRPTIRRKSLCRYLFRMKNFDLCGQPRFDSIFSINFFYDSFFRRFLIYLLEQEHGIYTGCDNETL